MTPTETFGLLGGLWRIQTPVPSAAAGNRDTDLREPAICGK
jgi:hypothetical protein